MDQTTPSAAAARFADPFRARTTSLIRPFRSSRIEWPRLSTLDVPVDVLPEDAIPNHSPLFYVDEAALKPGVRAMSQLAVDYLSQNAR